MRDGGNIDPAMSTALADRLAWPQHGVTVHTLPVARADIMLTAVLVARNIPAHAVV